LQNPHLMNYFVPSITICDQYRLLCHNVNVLFSNITNIEWRIRFKLACLVHKILNTGQWSPAIPYRAHTISQALKVHAFICQSLTFCSATQPFIWCSHCLGACPSDSSPCPRPWHPSLGPDPGPCHLSPGPCPGPCSKVLVNNTGLLIRAVIHFYNLV